MSIIGVSKEYCGNYKALSPVMPDWWLISILVKLFIVRSFPSAGVTGLEKPHTSMAAPVPSALPATEEDAGTTCVTKVRQSTFLFV